MTHALAIRHAHHSGAQVNDFMAARNRLKESFATIEEGGIPRHAAEHIATEIFDAIHDNVSTSKISPRSERNCVSK